MSNETKLHVAPDAPETLAANDNSPILTANDLRSALRYVFNNYKGKLPKEEMLQVIDETADRVRKWKAAA